MGLPGRADREVEVEPKRDERHLTDPNRRIHEPAETPAPAVAPAEEPVEVPA